MHTLQMWLRNSEKWVDVFDPFDTLQQAFEAQDAMWYLYPAILTQIESI